MNYNELKHFGILGMKWGIRRFQNTDGSYTAAGKERYGIGNSRQRSKIRIGDTSPEEEMTLSRLGMSWGPRSPKVEAQIKKERQQKNAKDILKNVKYEKDRQWVWDTKPGVKPAKGHWGKKYTHTAYDQPEIKNMEIIKKAHESLKEAHQKVFDAASESTKFYNNEKLVRQYQKIAANDYFEKYKDESGYTEDDRKRIEYGFMYDDLDQGDHTSFKAYCEHNGIDYKALEKKASDAVAEYSKEVEKVVYDLVGDDGDRLLNVTLMPNRLVDPTISNLVQRVLRDMADDDMYNNNVFNVWS